MSGKWRTEQLLDTISDEIIFKKTELKEAIVTQAESMNFSQHFINDLIQNLNENINKEISYVEISFLINDVINDEYRLKLDYYDSNQYLDSNKMTKYYDYSFVLTYYNDFKTKIIDSILDKEKLQNYEKTDIANFLYPYLFTIIQGIVIKLFQQNRDSLQQSLKETVQTVSFGYLYNSQKIVFSHHNLEESN